MKSPAFIDYVQATDGGRPPLAACGVGKVCAQAAANNRVKYTVNARVGCGGFLYSHNIFSRQSM